MVIARLGHGSTCKHTGNGPGPDRGECPLGMGGEDDTYPWRIPEPHMSSLQRWASGGGDVGPGVGIRVTNELRDMGWEQSDRLTSELLNTFEEGIIVIDRQGIIRAFNRAAARLAGCSPEEAIQEADRVVCHP